MPLNLPRVSLKFFWRKKRKKNNQCVLMLSNIRKNDWLIDWLMDGLIKLCEHHTLVLYWTLIITENLLWLTMGLWVAQIQKDLSVVSRSVSCADDDWWFTMLCSWINSDWCFGTGWNNMHNTIWVWLKLGDQIYRLIISFFDNGHKFMGHPAVSDTSMSCQVGYRLYIWLYIYISP